MEKRTESEPRKIIRIAITGPESTGKSELARELARHYHTKYNSEMARNYIEFLGRDYNYFDLLLIAKRQVAAEMRKEKVANTYLFCDTELSVIKIWAMHRYKRCHPWILDKLQEIKYDLYLLCDIDLPWTYDKQREHPHLRQYLFDKYREELTSRNLPFVVISGSGNERTQNAICAVDSLKKSDP